MNYKLRFYFVHDNILNVITENPLELYNANWEIIGNNLLTLYKTVLDSGHLCVSQCPAVITLIPKSNNVNSIDNFRPITLLYVDYKILSKILSERMKKNPTQGY